MEDLNLEIPEGVYDYLVKWALSNGYAITANPDCRLLHALENRDPVEKLKLEKEGKESGTTKEEAESLLANLHHLRENEAVPYAPVYFPEIRIDEEIQESGVFASWEKQGMSVEAHHSGVFWYIQRVKAEGAANIMCRSEVTELIRKLEYDRIVPPRMVVWTSGSLSKYWKTRTYLDTLAKALELVSMEQKRHFQGDWKVWEDVTEEALALRITDDLPSEAGFMVIGWFPGEHGRGGSYERNDCDTVQEALVSVVRMQEFEPEAICAIYACRYHEDLRPEEPDQPAAFKTFWRVVEYAEEFPTGITRSYGYSQEDNTEAVTEEAKTVITSRDTVNSDPPYSIEIYTLSKVVEVEA
jgi:hypothetical protein